MKRFWREYGIALVLIAVGIGGYLAYRSYQEEIKESVLAYSLDVIGTRLAALVDDPASQRAVSDSFAEFKEQVLDQEVSPQKVETIAAQVLNLSHSGATVTREQVAAMLSPKQAPEAAPWPEVESVGGVEPMPSLPPPAPEAFEALGERLEAMLAFEREWEEAMKAADAAQHELEAQVQFRFEHGLHVRLDTSLASLMDHREYRKLARELRNLEEKRLVVWKAISNGEDV